MRVQAIEAAISESNHIVGAGSNILSMVVKESKTMILDRCFPEILT